MGGQLRAHRGIRWTRYTFATLNFCVFWVCFGCVLGGYREVLASLRSGWLGMARDGSGWLGVGWMGRDATDSYEYAHGGAHSVRMMRPLT